MVQHHQLDHSLFPQCTSRLPRRAQPLPWEAIPSLLTRISQRMGYEDLRWIVYPQQLSSPLRLSTLSALSRKVDYHFLEQLLLLDEETLYLLTLHRFTTRLTTVEKSKYFKEDSVQRPLLSPALLQKFFLSAPFTKVCPRCLDENEPYDRLYWKCRFVLSCPEHAVILLGTCAGCNAPISSTRAILACCSQCGRVDYRACSTPSLLQAESFSRGSAFLLKMLGVSCSQHDAIREEVNSPLSNLLPHQYFQLFEGLRYILDQTLTRDHFSQVNSAMEVLPFDLFTLPLNTGTDYILFHVALFHTIFSHWPDTFYTFLDLFHRLVRETYGHGYFAKASHHLFFHYLAKRVFEPIVQIFRAYDNALWQGVAL